MADQSMSVMGVGLKAGAVVGGYLAASAIVSFAFSPAFRIAESYAAPLTAGIVLAVVGFAINLVAAMQMLAAHKRGALATGGLYRWFLNPMYFFQVFVTLPGVALMFNSWLVLSVVPVGAIAVNLFAREEARYLERAFGEKYRAYRRRVPIRY